MKPEIHPNYHPVIFVDGEHEIMTFSTMKSGEKRDVDGVEHYVVQMDISAFSHPFYTGKMKFVDATGRVEKFQKKYGWGKKAEEAKK